MTTLCFTTVKQKYEIAGSFLIISSVSFVCIAVVYLAATVPYSIADIHSSACVAKKSSAMERFYYEVSLLWGGIFYFAAAMIFKFKIDEDGETYEKILANNVQQSIPREGWWSYCLSNTYVLCGWLNLIGTLPLCLYPVFPFPWIMLMVVVVMILFIVAAQPHYLLMNKGKGSICFLSMVKLDHEETNDDVRYVSSSTSSLCSWTGEDFICVNKRPFASDVLIFLLVFCIFSVFFLVASLTNLACHHSSIAAYMWVITSLCFTIGLFFWYHASIAPSPLRNRRKYDSDDGLLGIDNIFKA